MSVLDTFDMRGRTAIVTGGNRGIGYGIAQGLAEAGADVTIANRTTEECHAATDELADATDAAVIGVPTDVTDEDAVDALVSETVEEFGSVDVLVNGAGVAAHAFAVNLSTDRFRNTLDINTTGSFLCAKRVAEEMINDDGGSIINVSSMSAFVANHPQCHADYQASKAALEGLKNQLAAEWARFGIRVNNINPGFVDTDMLADDEDVRETWREWMLLEEFANPADIAPLALYLASDASSYVTGSSVVIDGGYTVR